MTKKTISFSFLLLFAAACGPAPKKILSTPSLPALLEMENKIEVGLDYVYKDGVCDVVEYQSPELGNWTLIVVADHETKALVSDILKSVRPGEPAPVVMTGPEYASGFSGYKPAGDKDDVTPERKIAGLKEKLKKHPAVIYRYLKEKSK